MTSLAKAVTTIRKEAMVNSMCSAGRLTTVACHRQIDKIIIGYYNVIT